MADYFNSPNAGQNRRAWLNGLLGSIGGSADYYLGPTGVPDRARSAGQIADMVSPVSGTLRSMDAAGRGNYGESALEGVGVLAPAAIAARFGAPAAKAVVETMTGTGNALADTGRRITDAIPSDAIYAGRSLAGGDMRGVLDAITPGRPAQGLGADAVAPGINAYHGSPHSFDKFSMDAIGTGEGAQAYGHGLYFTETEDIARGYKQSISRNSEQLRKIAEETGGLTGDAAEMLSYQFSQDNFHGKGFDNWLDGLKDGLGKEWYSGRVKEAVDQILDREVEASHAVGQMRAPGSMYEVNINADPAAFLDWDAPLSAQSEKVQSAWDKFLGTKQAARADEGMGGALLGGRGQFENPTGRDFLGAYSEAAPHNPADAFDYQPKFSNVLKRQGIPGIKYLDGASRSAGAGSRNFVVFDENLINIVKKYGIVGAAAMLGASVMDVEQAMAQGSQPQPQQQPQGLLSMGAQ